jgi:hypothetical protein
VLLVQARDLEFGSEDSLVAHAMSKLQGVIAPGKRSDEEAAIVHSALRHPPITLVLDGLDETHSPSAMKRAITFWLESQLGQCSVLITTSRPEFWRKCADESWERWMPIIGIDQRTRAAEAPPNLGAARGDVASGLPLPGRFTPRELESAWVSAGHKLSDLHAFGEAFRNELRHPFTLRVYLDLCGNQGRILAAMTRMELMELWLNERLELESRKVDRLTPDLLKRTLIIVARAIMEAGGGAISVDALGSVPRFDERKPPGDVVNRLIDANILETQAGRSDLIPFSVEALQDFYLGEADVQDLQIDPKSVSQAFAELSFTDTHQRLLQIGRRSTDNEPREEFVQRLADTDPFKAAIILAASPERYPAQLRARIASDLGTLIESRHRVRAAAAITALGNLACEESIAVLKNRLLPPAQPHKYVRSIGARSFVKLGVLEAARFVYEFGRFGPVGADSHYFRDDVALLRNAAPDFRSALADICVGELFAPTGDTRHARAVQILALLGDERLVVHLERRLEANSLLANYENHALVAVGSDPAWRLLAQCVRAIGKKLLKPIREHWPLSMRR